MGAMSWQQFVERLKKTSVILTLPEPGSGRVWTHPNRLYYQTTTMVPEGNGETWPLYMVNGESAGALEMTEGDPVFLMHPNREQEFIHLVQAENWQAVKAKEASE